MNLKEAILTYKKVRRPHWDENDSFQYFKAKTGPYKELVDCDYLVLQESGVESFSTSIDLYPEDILSEDYEVLEDV